MICALVIEQKKTHTKIRNSTVTVTTAATVTVRVTAAAVNCKMKIVSNNLKIIVNTE